MKTRGVAVLVLAACGGSKHAPAPSPSSDAIAVETFVEVAVGPGNLAVTPDRRLVTSLHQFYAPEHAVVELRSASGGPALGEPLPGAATTTATVLPFPEPAAYAVSGAPALDSVLGIRADEQGVVWMLDNGMRRSGKRQLVGWNAPANKLERIIDLQAASPADAFLNDLAVDRTNAAIYIADPAGGKNAALIVIDLPSGTARRVLEGHASVIPTEQDLVIDGTPVAMKQADGTVIRPHVGVNPIALDTADEWLYFGPMHGDKLYRVRTADLRAGAADLASRVEVYADRPITDGISIDSAGNIYLGDLANHAIGAIGADRRYRELARGPELSWIDAFSFGPDGYYYVVANQLHRSAVLHAGVDATTPPFRIVRFRPLAPGRVGR